MSLLRVLLVSVIVVLLMASVAVAAPAGPAASAPFAPLVIDREERDCTQIPPEELPPVALASTPVLPLEVRVMVEEDDLPLAKGYIRTTRGAFARIGIKLRVRYEKVEPPPAWDTAGALGAGPGRDEIFEFMKHHFDGERPDGTDLVYLMTRHWDGGVADCIGGVRFADRAFAFGSIDYAAEGVVPSPTVDEGVIAAHELGHLLGAHHHYANCAEALPSGATRGDTGPCTTMAPLAAAASSTFSTLETSFIRSYTARFAKG